MIYLRRFDDGIEPGINNILGAIYQYFSCFFCFHLDRKETLINKIFLKARFKAKDLGVNEYLWNIVLHKDRIPGSIVDTENTISTKPIFIFSGLALSSLDLDNYFSK